jgi:hypothetical protein
VLAVLVAIPVTGMLVGTLAPGPLAEAGPAPVQLLPSDGPAARTPTRAPAAEAPAVARSQPRRPVARSTSPTGRSYWAGKIPDRGSGRFRTADLSGPVAGKGGQLLRYAVRVERELPFDPDVVARQVQRTLSDERSWIGSRQWRMQLVDDVDRADFTVLVATPKTTDRYCLPLRTWGRLSCQDGSRAVLNARRWAFGASTYDGDVAGYRLYLVNHEVGHVLGLGHEQCRRRGARAPVMVQQTKSLQGCRPNAWPSPGR